MPKCQRNVLFDDKSSPRRQPETVCFPQFDEGASGGGKNARFPTHFSQPQMDYAFSEIGPFSWPFFKIETRFSGRSADELTKLDQFNRLNQLK